MVRVVFYEKPGCGGNARQKALMVRSGHEVEARNLLMAPWTEATLRSCFGTKPVSDWFNLSSPRVKNGDVDPSGLSEKEALLLMLEDPLLIRRPLIEAEGRREAGFEADLIASWIGLVAPDTPVTEMCVKGTSSASAPGICAQTRAKSLEQPEE